MSTKGGLSNKRGERKSGESKKRGPKSARRGYVAQAALTRLCRSAGALRVGSDVYDHEVARMQAFVETITRDAVKFAMHAGRSTIMEEDVANANSKISF